MMLADAAVPARKALHIYVLRAGKPCVVSVSPDGRTELSVETFDSDYRALARLSQLAGW